MFHSGVKGKDKKRKKLFYNTALMTLSLLIYLSFHSSLSSQEKALLVVTFSGGMIHICYFLLVRHKAYIKFNEDNMEIAQIPILGSKRILYRHIQNVVMVQSEMLTLNLADGSEETIYEEKLTDGDSFEEIMDRLADKLGPSSN